MDNVIPPHQLLIDALVTVNLYFAIAGIIVPALQKCKISPVLAYLICGIIIGPYGIAQFVNKYPWVAYISVADSGNVYLVGELGIMMLMFKIGLDLPIARLMELKKYIFGLGTLQIVISATVIFFVAKYYNNSMKHSILLGFSLALSSTAIVMKLLEEKKMANRSIGILCFSILLMQDLAVIPMLILTSIFSTSDANIFIAIGEAVFFGIITILLIYFLGKKVITPLMRSISFSTTHEWLTSIIVFLLLLISLITYKSGLSLALGAFIIGLLIAETEFVHEVKIIVGPIKGLFLGIFFLSIGMMINVSDLFNSFPLVAASVIGLFLIKSVIIFSLCLLFRVSLTNSVQAAVYLSEPGEFALMILSAAFVGGMLPQEDVEFFMLVTVFAMILTPFVFNLGPMLSNFINSMLTKLDKDIEHKAIDIKIETGHVVICGFGKVGKLIADALTAQMIPYIAFDIEGKVVQESKQKNYNIKYGDVRLNNFWSHLVEKKIDAAVIVIDDLESTKLTLTSIKKNMPMLPVFVRSNDSEGLKQLYDLGATNVVPESLESSLRIARVIMDELDVKAHESDKIISSLREKILTKY